MGAQAAAGGGGKQPVWTRTVVVSDKGKGIYGHMPRVYPHPTLTIVTLATIIFTIIITTITTLTITTTTT